MSRHPPEPSLLRRVASKFLAEKDEAVDALVLAREVLGISGGPPHVARHLVATLLEGHAGFIREGECGWRYQAPPERLGVSPHRASFLALESAAWTDPGGSRHLVEVAGVSIALPVRECAGQTPRAGEEPPRVSFSYLIRPETASPPGLAAARLALEGLDPEELASLPPLAELLPRITADIEEAIVVSYRPTDTLLPLADALATSWGLSLEVEDLSLRRLARQVLPDIPHRELEELASALGLPHHVSPRAGDQATLAAQVLGELSSRLGEARSFSPLDLLEIQYGEAPEVDLGSRLFDHAWLEGLPETPGVYRLYDRREELLYVGKARNLRRRVSSYFRRSWRPDERQERISRHAHRIEVEECGSEIMALLREEEDIRQKRPLLNVQRAVLPRPAGLPGLRNLAVLLPAANAEAGVLFFYRPAKPLSHVTVKREGALSAHEREELRARIRDALAPPAAVELDEAQRARLGIFTSWLGLHRHRQHTVNLEAAAGEEHALELVENLRRGLPGTGEEGPEPDGVEYR